MGRHLLIMAISFAVAGFGMDSVTALNKLLEGNARYANSQLKHPEQGEDRRRLVAHGQHPFATILGCSDSRVPPEILFDQGLGDLFVVREAGNVIDDIVLGNIEYGVEHLHTPLILVLGHSHCGAAEAAAQGEKIGHIGAITKEFEKAIAMARSESGDLVENIVRKNVQIVVERLSQSEPILKAKVDKGDIKIVGALYDLDSGKVALLAPLEKANRNPDAKTSAGNGRRLKKEQQKRR